MYRGIFGLELPIVRKCCCLPARNGLLILGYTNLVTSLLIVPIIGVLIILQYNYPKEGETEESKLIEVISLAFVIVDIILTTLMLVGAHTRNVLLLKISFFSGAIYAAVTLCYDVISFVDLHYVLIIFYFLSYFLYIYMLFLLYNTIYIIKERQEVQYHHHDESDPL